MASARRTRGRAAGSRRLEAAALLVAIVVGCQLLWLAVPAATLWGLSRLVDSADSYLLLSFMVVPCSLVGFAWVLTLADRRYLSITAAPPAEEEEEDEERRLRGPLESMLPTSIVLAGLTLLLWAAVFADHMSLGVELAGARPSPAPQVLASGADRHEARL